jgi:hypothetical protein
MKGFIEMTLKNMATPLGFITGVAITFIIISIAIL